MDKLSNYIQNGKPINPIKVASVFACIGVVLGLLANFFFSHIVQTSDFQKFVDDFPTIELQQGQIQSSQNIIWERKVPHTNMTIFIDTTRDAFSTFSNPNALYLSKTKFYAVNNGQIQTIPLSDEAITLTSKAIRESIPNLIRGLSIVIGFIIFIVLGIGYIGTIFVLRLLCWMFKKKNDKQVLLRSALVGWISIFILDVILHCIGYGLNGVVGIISAAIIALFALHTTLQKN